MELGAWRAAVPAGILQLEACRLKLAAWSLGLSFRHYAVKLLLSPCIAYAILYNILGDRKPF